MQLKTKKILVLVGAIVIAGIVYFIIRKKSLATNRVKTVNGLNNNNMLETVVTPKIIKPIDPPVEPPIDPPVDPAPGLTAPNWNIGLSSMFGYGSSWQNEFNKIQGGDSSFWFYGKSNGNSYPNGKNGNGYETVHFSSHSITTAQGYAGVISKCRYKLRDAANNVVLYVDDTKGGFHYFYGNDLRANNHPDDVLRYLPTGTYSLEYTNTSESVAPQRVEFYQQHQNNTFDYQINEVVQSGQSITREIVISDTGSEPNTFYKLNNNLL